MSTMFLRLKWYPENTASEAEEAGYGGKSSGECAWKNADQRGTCRRASGIVRGTGCHGQSDKGGESCLFG